MIVFRDHEHDMAFIIKFRWEIWFFLGGFHEPPSPSTWAKTRYNTMVTRQELLFLLQLC